MVKVVARIQESQQITIKRIAAETARIIAQENAKIISLAQGMLEIIIYFFRHPKFAHIFRSLRSHGETDSR